jgi:hypothetical protein
MPILAWVYARQSTVIELEMRTKTFAFYLSTESAVNIKQKGRAELDDIKARQPCFNKP